MKFSEAMKALEQGKKIRCVHWRKGVYYYFDSEGVLRDQNGNDDGLSIDSLNRTWELFEEPPKKKQVWQWRRKYKNSPWLVSEGLMTEKEAAEYFMNVKHEIHAGPWEVNE